MEEGIAAVNAAYAAGPAWAATAPRKRGEILRKAFELMTARLEWFAQLISLENGKALPDARGEAAYAAEFFRWNSEEAVRAGGELGLSPSNGNRMLVQYQPIGVAVLVTPWNFPAAMVTRKIGPALAAGCTCILKPATETPLTAYAMAALLAEAGVPPGVVNVITTSTSGAVVGAMLHDPRVRKLSFTGSTEVGRVLLKQAADQVINCSMELGGNAPFIVFDDADLDAESGWRDVSQDAQRRRSLHCSQSLLCPAQSLRGIQRTPDCENAQYGDGQRARPGHDARSPDQCGRS
ncbi:MAG: Succinate semialdehyde dehydrogenase [Herminiimonas sp.]|nr:Succinate semialdehyde dehydrogenase [Herminiimonas sp.]